METMVLIGVPTSEMARWAAFYDYFNMIDRPDNTIATFSHGQSPARSRNIIIEQALHHNCSHIFFLDDDCIVRPNVIKQLLAHDVDMVSGLYLMRNYPHFPIMFDEAFDDGRCKFSFLEDGRKGLVEAVNCGLGACLIKTEIFKTMPKPWVTLGELEKDHWCDDIAFFNRARKLGFKLFVDLECPVGHVVNSVIWPVRDGDKWHTIYDTNSAEKFKVPQVTPTKAEIDTNLAASGIVR
jgi:hypothetical protein